MVEIQTQLKHKENSLWPYHFLIDEATTNVLSSADHKRILCTINDQEQIHCALMPLGKGSFIMLNQKLVRRLMLQPGEMVKLKLEKDTSTYGVPMPESLQIMLDQDEEGSHYFHELTPGKQRSLIHIVGKVKNIDKQINKSLAILEHLKELKGRLDFKLLNQKIKAYNQKTL